MERGLLELGGHSRAGLLRLACSSCQVSLSSSSVTAALGVQDPRRGPVNLALGPRRRQLGPCPLWPGCPAKLPELRGHFACAPPAPGPLLRPPTRGQPISDRRFAAQGSVLFHHLMRPRLPRPADGVSHPQLHCPGRELVVTGGVTAASEGTREVPPLAWRRQRGGRACTEHPLAGTGLGSGEGGGEAGAGLGWGVGAWGASLREARGVSPPPPSERSVQVLSGAPALPPPP